MQFHNDVGQDNDVDGNENAEVRDPSKVLEALYVKHSLILNYDERFGLAEAAFCYANHTRERRADDSVSRLVEHGCGPLNDENGKRLYEAFRRRAYKACMSSSAYPVKHDDLVGQAECISGSTCPCKHSACSDDIVQQVARTRERTLLVRRNDVDSIAAVCGVRLDAQENQKFRERLEQRRLILRGCMFDKRSAMQVVTTMWRPWPMNVGDPNEIFREGVEAGLSDVQATCVAHRTLLTPFL